MADDLPDLEHYAMKSDYGRLTGVAVACHAISDAYLLMHVGVGCKYKASHLMSHDWTRASTLRMGWTEVGDRDLITGASERIAPYGRSWQGRMDSGFVCVVSVTFLELAGEDAADKVVQLDETLPVPAVMVPALGFDGDEFLGYATVVREVLNRVPWDKGPADPRQVSLLGYWFDRYEGDHSGNFMQIQGMLKGIGLELGPVVLSGRRFAEHEDVARSGVLIGLPYLAPIEKKLRRQLRDAGRELTSTDLPMGFAGTRRWLHAVARAARVDPRRVDLYLDRRIERTAEPLKKMVSRWRTEQVAVFGEAPMAAGLCAMLLELGMRPTLVGLRGPSLGGEAAFRGVLERNGQALPDDVEILEQPSLARIEERLTTMLREGRLNGVVGSATELAVLRGRRPEDVMPGRWAEGQSGPFLLELGYPCQSYHALQQMPFMGISGVATLAQRLVEAPRLWDTGRILE